MGKSRRKLAPKWQYVGLGALAVVTAGTVGFAFLVPREAAPVPASVASYTPPVQTQKPVTKVVFIGDSYTQGAGAPRTLGWVDRLGRNQAWHVTNLGRGGTGYVKEITSRTVAKNACGKDRCPNYAAMIPEAVAAAPAVVIVAGGRNDTGVDPQVEGEAIRAFYAQLRAALPKAKIVAFNALWDSTAPPAPIAQISADVKSAVTTAGGTYLDAGQPLADKPELVAPDGVHPREMGHAAIFEANLKQLQAAGVAVK